MQNNGASVSDQAGRASHGASISVESPPSGDHPSRRPMAALAQAVLELKLSEGVFRQYGFQHLDKAEEARDDPREFNSRMQKAYRNTERADCCKRALDLFEANGGIDAYTAKATLTLSAETGNTGSVRRIVARCRQAFAQGTPHD